MAMFLSGISTIVIRRIGRWSSEAFLEYIREQVQDFTAGVSQKMLQFENFTNMGGSTVKKMDTIKPTEDKENGPIPIPYAVKFSNLVLNEEDTHTRRRRPRR